MHVAVSAVVRGWWLKGASSALIDEAATRNEHWQHRKAAARTSNVKRTRRKLRQKGIYLKDLIRCKWP